MKRKIVKIFLMMLGIIVLSLVSKNNVMAAKKPTLNKKKVTINVAKRYTIKIKNTKVKATWKIKSGKKFIVFRNKKNTSVVVLGKKAGTAKVQATVSGKKLICSVIVKPIAKNDNKEENNDDKTDEKQDNKENQSEDESERTEETIYDETEINKNVEKNATDIANLNTFIEAFNALGAVIPKDVNDARYFVWNQETGRLEKLYLNDVNLYGDISFASLPDVKYIFCNDNPYMTSVDISRNTGLVSFTCLNATGVETIDVSVNLNTPGYSLEMYEIDANINVIE